MNVGFASLLSAMALVGAGCSQAPTTAAPAAAQGAAPLKLAGSTDFPGYTGDFDHFAIDAKNNRLFLAGEENAEVEVLDLASGKIIQRLKSYGAPHSLLFMPDRNELLVVDGEKPSPVLDAMTLAVKRTYNLPKGADSVGYDSSTKHLWVVTGGKDVPKKDSDLIELDPATGKTMKSVHFEANHVEAMAVEQNGPNIYINVTDKNFLAVVDKASGKIVKRVAIQEAQQNAPIAFDEVKRRLFVVTRKPGKLLVLNADTGATIASFVAPERTDEVVWDAANRRVYVAGGQGYVSVVQQDDADHYREVAKVTSLPGAKTAVLDASAHRLWVAASPGESKTMGKLLWFDVAGR